MRISLIWAMSRNRVIGRNNSLPWHLPREMQHFRDSTRNAPVVMGRKTLESIGKPLPGRPNVMVSSQAPRVPGVSWARSVPEAIRIARLLKPDAADTWIAGGARIYEESLPHAHRLVCTVVETEAEGDVWFPEYDESGWKLTDEHRHAPDDQNPYEFVIRWFSRLGSALDL